MSFVTKFASAKPIAIAFVIGYLGFTGLSHYSTLQPPSLGLSIEACGDSMCVGYVMPASHAWDEGVRPGMLVHSINGFPPDVNTVELDGDDEIVLETSPEEFLTLSPNQTAFTENSMKASLWILGAIFALLGTTVVLRRPDSKTACIFAVFAGVTAISLTIGPASTASGVRWALMMQMITLLPLGFLCLLFVVTLLDIKSRLFSSFLLPALTAIWLVIFAGYIIAALVRPTLYDIVRPSIFLFVSILIVISIGVLALASVRHRTSELRQQSRIALAGIALGTLPFIFLTLIPESLRIGALIPIHFSVLPIGLMPLFFAYAILQHQLLGIRRLIHRGMVYLIASTLLVLITSIVLYIIFTQFLGEQNSNLSLPLMIAIILSGIALFYPLRWLTRRLVDKLIYGGVPDYTTLIEAVRTDLLVPGQTNDVANDMAKILVKLLNLESVLIFLGRNPKDAELVAAQGHRAVEVQKDFYPGLSSDIERLNEKALIEARWESDSLLFAGLTLPGAYFGFMILGPKHGGEIFLPEERALIANIAPVLALAIDKSVQSQQLRGLNWQLTKAGERERGNIASDIHDGPLQKAILLAGVGNGRVQDDPAVVAKELAAELREICSRLRPAILDHLGAVSSIEWLLDEARKRHRISTELSLFNVRVDERFLPDTELALFRVTQEAINNTVKHANADSIMVLLDKEENTLVLEISDDGEGMTRQFGISSSGGFGLASMKERVLQINGSFEVQTTPGVGTTLTAKIPIDNKSRE